MDCESRRLVTGVVRWFNQKKGYGFVDVPGEPDVLLHGNVVRSFWQGLVYAGFSVTFYLEETERGLQVNEIVELIGSGRPKDVALAVDFGLDESGLQQLEILPARVKWFHLSLGFGFVNVFGTAKDIYLHRSILEHSEFVSLREGDAIAVRILDTKKGPAVVDVLNWRDGIESS